MEFTLGAQALAFFKHGTQAPDWVPLYDTKVLSGTVNDIPNVLYTGTPVSGVSFTRNRISLYFLRARLRATAGPWGTFLTMTPKTTS